MKSPFLSPALLVVVTAFAAVALVALRPAMTMALWTDDLYSLTTAEENAGQIIRLCASAQPNYYDHPPLYFLLLHQVLYFTNSPFGLRLLSLFSVAAATALAAGALLRRSGLGPALALAVVLPSHPAVAFQATNVRMYPLYLLESVAAGVLALALLRGNRRHALGLALVLAAALYTVYLAVLLLAVMAVLGALFTLFPTQLGQSERGGGRLMLLSVAGSVVLYLPWWPVFWKVLSSAGGGAGSEETSARKLLGLAAQLASTWPLGALFLAGAGGLALAPRAIWRPAAAAGAATVCAVVALAVASPPGRALDLRYLLFCVPLFAALAVTGGTFLLRRIIPHARWRVAAGVAVILLVFWSGRQRAQEQYFAPEPDWWGVAADLEKHALPHEIILTGGFLSGEAVMYHLKHPGRFSFVHYVTRFDEFRRHAADPRVVWFVNAAPLPPEYAAVRDGAFAYRKTYGGNRGAGLIEVASKKPFPGAR